MRMPAAVMPPPCAFEVSAVPRARRAAAGTALDDIGNVPVYLAGMDCRAEFNAAWDKRLAISHLSDLVRIRALHGDSVDFYSSCKIWRQGRPGSTQPINAVHIPLPSVPECGVVPEL